MRNLSIIKAIAALALFGGMTTAQAVHEVPSPCQNESPPGPGASTDGCVFLADQGNVYNPTTGERSGTATPGSTITIDIYMDFTNDQTVGGGFDILYDEAAVDSVSFAFDANFPDDTIFRTNGRPDGMDTAGDGIYQDIGFGLFEGFGGEDDPPMGNPNPNPGGEAGMQFIGTLTIALASGFIGMTTFDFMEATDPPPEAPGPFTSNEGTDQDVSFFAYNLTVVPLPGAVWLMLGGLGALFGFARRKVSGAASA